jgi:Recombination endonuclease VII
MKTCRKCGIEKETSEFFKNDHNSDGLHSYCKPCLLAVDKQNRWARNGQTGPMRVKLKQPTDGTWICTKCGEQKPVSEFTPNGKRADGQTRYRSQCKKCSADGLRGFHDANPEKRRTYYLSTKFNLSTQTFDLLFATQGKKCAVCGCTEPTGHGWTIDHDHACCSGEASCGKCVRGILCMNCNNALGCVRDNPDVLRKAAEYLEKFKPTPDDEISLE